MNVERSDHISDATLLENFYHDHNNQWLGMLLQRYTLMLLGVCMKYLKNEEDAKDSVQQIFLKVIIEIEKYKVDYFKSWLYMVAKNHCLQKIRSNKNISTTELPGDFMQLDEPLHLEEVLNKEVKFELMEKCLEQLATDQKQMVELFYLQEKSYKEISEITGNDWNLVRSRIQNGRRNLKICMEENSSE